MILFICTDEDMGMWFNNRRQSRDRVLRKRILGIVGDGILWMNSYSAAQFTERTSIRIDEDFLEKAKDGEFCFAEEPPLLPYEYLFEQIIMYRWNRSYPSDLHFDIPLEAHGWIQIGRAHV